VLEDSDRLVSHILMDSRLARVVGEVPAERPNRSERTPGSPIVGYINSNTDGDDGGPLTDYDVIGSAITGTGLFALREVPTFNLLCIPPLAREQDVGLGTLMIAARYCRDRHGESRAEWAARMAVPERKRGDVFPTGGGSRSPARPARDFRLVWRGGGHDRARG
jgi:hypothetical protein